jgi:hypothetical protein
MRVGQAACMGEVKNAYRTFVSKTAQENKWHKGNINMNLRETEYNAVYMMNWIML